MSRLWQRHRANHPDRGPTIDEFVALFQTLWTLNEFWSEE